MAVRSEDHLSAACQHLTRILVDDCLMRRNIDAAVFLCAGQSEHVVILIDRAAHCTETVVTVCQNVRNRKFLESRSTRCLDDPDECNIVGRQLVKLDLQILHITGSIVRT